MSLARIASRSTKLALSLAVTSAMIPHLPAQAEGGSPSETVLKIAIALFAKSLSVASVAIY
jgi:hypothetical protein